MVLKGLGNPHPRAGHRNLGVSHAAWARATAYLSLKEYLIIIYSRRIGIVGYALTDKNSRSSAEDVYINFPTWCCPEAPTIVSCRLAQALSKRTKIYVAFLAISCKGLSGSRSRTQGSTLNCQNLRFCQSLF